MVGRPHAQERLQESSHLDTIFDELDLEFEDNTPRSTPARPRSLSIPAAPSRMSIGTPDVDDAMVLISDLTSGADELGSPFNDVTFYESGATTSTTLASSKKRSKAPLSDEEIGGFEDRDVVASRDAALQRVRLGASVNSVSLIYFTM